MDIFCSFFLNCCRHVIERNDTFHNALIVDNGNRHQILLREDATDLLLVQVDRDFQNVGAHDLRNFFPRRCREEFTERNHAQKFLVMIENVSIINCFNVGLGLNADIADRFIYRHVRAQTNEAGTHQAPGSVFSVSEQGCNFTFGLRIEQR
ncbi:hypothetical protein D3C72_1550630 [compost metagenome]